MIFQNRNLTHCGFCFAFLGFKSPQYKHKKSAVAGYLNDYYRVPLCFFFVQIYLLCGFNFGIHYRHVLLHPSTRQIANHKSFRGARLGGQGKIFQAAGIEFVSGKREGV